MSAMWSYVIIYINILNNLQELNSDISDSFHQDILDFSFLKVSHDTRLQNSQVQDASSVATSGTSRSRSHGLRFRILKKWPVISSWSHGSDENWFTIFRQTLGAVLCPFWETATGFTGSQSFGELKSEVRAASQWKLQEDWYLSLYLFASLQGCVFRYIFFALFTWKIYIYIYVLLYMYIYIW